MEQDCPLLKDTNASVKLLGLEALMVPFLQFTSSQRASMFASHIVQSLPPDKAEHPYIYTGYESVIGRYDFNQTKRDQDMYIIDVIPRYPENKGAKPLKMNPRSTVIYIGQDDGMAHYFHLDRYTKGTDGYGYWNNIYNQNYLKPSVIVPKEINFSSSPSHLGANGYGMGVNANVVFMTLPDVNNDAFIISDRLAEKLHTYSFSTLVINISPNQVPLNLYGDQEEHKFVPDLGEFVRDDGILCGFRTPTDSTFVSDMMSLSTPYTLHDELYFAPPGSQIVDIDFKVSATRDRVKTDKALFSQVDKYLDPDKEYLKRIYRAYDYIKKNNIPLSPEFNTFITDTMAPLLTYGHKIPNIHSKKNKHSIKLCRGKEKIEFICLEITFATPRSIDNANKISDRVGGKGVIADIRPLAEMPTDEYGYKADIVVDGQGVQNRMNQSRLYESGINRVSMFVQRQALAIRNEKGDAEAVEYVLDYIKMINPAYEELIVRDKARKNPEYFMDTLARAEQKEMIGIYIMIPPFWKHINADLILRLEEKYQVKSTPLTFYPRDENGKPYKSVTKEAISIGSEYFYLLYTIPKAKAPGVGYINQFRVPVKPSQHARHQSLIGLTPLRLGEDESRIETMCAGAEAVVRLMGMHANSSEAVKKVSNTLLTVDNPSLIKRIDVSTEEIQATNNIIGVGKHLMSTMGINMDNIYCEAFDETKFVADLNTKHPGQF